MCKLPPETDVYTVPDTTSSYTIQAKSGIYEIVYSEPIEPSPFTDVVESSSECMDFQPYTPIYTLPSDLQKCEVPLKAFGSNIREIRELGKRVLGKVILAETVGLSANDLVYK